MTKNNIQFTLRHCCSKWVVRDKIRPPAVVGTGCLHAGKKATKAVPKVAKFRPVKSIFATRFDVKTSTENIANCIMIEGHFERLKGIQLFIFGFALQQCLVSFCNYTNSTTTCNMTPRFRFKSGLKHEEEFNTDKSDSDQRVPRRRRGSKRNQERSGRKQVYGP